MVIMTLFTIQPTRSKILRIRIINKTLAMSIIISDELLTATRMTEAEMKQEIAVLLFQKENK